MKKIILLLFSILLLTGCQTESISDSLLLQENQEALKSSDKINVCHKGKIINISLNAVSAHQAHGDAIDMDGDGYYDIENECMDSVDCDDTDPAVHLSDVTDIRLGGQPGDGFIGPTCNGDGTYRTCFYVSGSNLPGQNPYYQLKINGVEYPVAAVFTDGAYRVVCATDLPLDEIDCDVFIQLDEKCSSLEVSDLYDAPTCSESNKKDVVKTTLGDNKTSVWLK
jgi:hypothetical protein